MTATDEDRMIGRLLDGRFVVRERIGAGGMGRVYRAWQESVGRDVAIKVVDERLAGERAVARRFLREAHLASRLSHPNTVAIHDFGQAADGTLYLVMELLSGPTLAAALRTGPMPLARIVEIGGQLCDALAAAHAAGIVHRDLKPGNVLLVDDPAGRDLVKVLDFGLAKSIDEEDPGSPITTSSVIIGTPHYMAPELIAGKPSGPASDLYALGCVLFELIVGRPPFAPSTGDEVYRRHLNAPPVLDRVPPPLRDLIGALLAKPPASRPPSAAAVRASLDAARRALDAADADLRSDPYLVVNLSERTPTSDTDTTRPLRQSPAAVPPPAVSPPAVSPPAVPPAAPSPSPSRARKLPGVIVVFSLAAISAAAWLLLRDGSSRAEPSPAARAATSAAIPADATPSPTAAPSPTTTPSPTVDAAPTPTSSDAAVAEPAPAHALDAAPRPPRIRKNDPKPPPPSPDAAVAPAVAPVPPPPPAHEDAGPDFVLPGN